MIYMRDKTGQQDEWMEIHHTNIFAEDIEHWFNRVDFLVEGVEYTTDSDQFQQALFWERLKA